MLDSWENIVLIIKNPWFIALILTAISLESLIKFMRRFYTKEQRREIEEFNKFQKFIAENSEYRRVYKKANLRIVLFISSPLILGVVFLSLYAIFISGEFNMVCFGDKLIHFGTLFITLGGLYSIKKDSINRWLLGDDFSRYKEIERLLNIEKYDSAVRPFGYFVTILGLISFVALFFRS